MADSALEVAQAEAYKQAVVAALIDRGYLPRPTTLTAMQRQSLRQLRAAKARKRRGARKYLDPDVMLPIGTPAPETMREAKKRPVGVPSRWESAAPASGCRELRTVAGVHALKQERDAYGATLVVAAPIAAAWGGYEYRKLVRSPLPSD